MNTRAGLPVRQGSPPGPSPRPRAESPPSAWLAAAARAASEQAELALAAAEIERWLKRSGCAAVDTARVLDCVARVRLGAALTGGDLAEILLSGSAPGQTNGGAGPTSAGCVRPPD